MTIKDFPGRFDAAEWLAKLRKLAEEERTFVTRHAEERMLERGITQRQVIRCLQKGRLSEGPARKTTGNIRASLEIVDSGEIIRIVAEIHERSISYVVVITAISI